jgi:hypothetical protein
VERPLAGVRIVLSSAVAACARQPSLGKVYRLKESTTVSIQLASNIKLQG